MLNLHVLGTIMIDAGSRADSVRIQRVMDTEHGLGNVTGDIMLNTVLNHWMNYYGKPNTVKTDPTRSCCHEYPSVLTVILWTRLGKLECWGKQWIPSNRQQHVWLEELLTVSQFKKSSKSALPLTTTCCTEIEDSLRGSCCWEDIAAIKLRVARARPP